MAWYAGRSWKREEIVARVGDPLQIAGARGCTLTDGKADGVRAVEITTGSGFSFIVLPGRGMDIPFASYKGRGIGFFSGTGITAPGYYEEQDLRWLRSFFGGLLTTCGITTSGAPSVDRGRPYGLHGRLANAAAENVSIDQEWDGDELPIRVSGKIREAEAMGENLSLTRTFETRLGQRGFRLHDRVMNRGWSAQPLMLLYHFNYGFPLLGPTSRITGPFTKSVARDEEARKDRGEEECLVFPEPIHDYAEKVFFHSLATDAQGRTFYMLANPDIGDGTPLAVVVRWNRRELPALCEWKMPRKGFYALGLEPGTCLPLGRGTLREQGTLPMIEPQAQYDVTIDFEVLDTRAEIEAVVKEARGLVG
jgi:hypothetical protein